MNPLVLSILTGIIGNAAGTGIGNQIAPPVTIEKPRAEQSKAALYIAAGAAVLLVAVIIIAVVYSKKK